MKTNHHQCTEPNPVLPVGDTTQFFVSLAQKSGFTRQDDSRDFIHQLQHIVNAFARALQESDESVTFREAAAFSLLARTHRRPSTRADLRSYINRMCDYRDFGDLSLRYISIPHCRQMLDECFGHSAHTYRKAQSILHSIFELAGRQYWCERNPAKAILRPPVNEKRIEILTLHQIQKLMGAMQDSPALACMDAAVRLMLWCGIRPMEIRRLRWRDIDNIEQVVYIESHTSKTGGARAVPLRGGAQKLLSEKHADDDLIAPADWTRLWHRLRESAGFPHWQNDALRHTFASMHLKRFHNLTLLQEEMGHRSSALLQTRYLNLRGLRKGTAYRFWRADFWN